MVQRCAGREPRAALTVCLAGRGGRVAAAALTAAGGGAGGQGGQRLGGFGRLQDGKTREGKGAHVTHAGESIIGRKRGEGKGGQGR